MKSGFLFIIVLFFLSIFSAVSKAIDPALPKGVGNPASRATVPPSSISSGLVRSPNPIDASSNLVITGNIAGGRHFRGVVPYNAISDFGGSLGSTSMDSFLRYSMDTGDFEPFTGRPTPYYSPTRTVTTIRPGRVDTVSPPSGSIDGRATIERPGSVATGTVTALPYSYLATSVVRPVTQQPNRRPLSMTTQELERMLSSEIKRYPLDDRADRSAQTGRQYQQQMEQFRQQLKKVSDRTAELESSLKSEGKQAADAERQKGGNLQPQSAEEARMLKPQKGEGQIDVYEQMKLQLIDSPSQARQYPQQKYPAVERAGDNILAGKESDKPASQFIAAAKTESGKQDVKREESSQQKRLSDIGLSVARAESILGEHKSFASLSRDKFNEYMSLAENYLKQGKYYLAADSYTLASIYKPDDPLAYAGKSHALFASGEYMSSALFLSRAIEIFPEYVRFKVDIEAMLGDRDKLESRIADVQQWIDSSGAAELQFLLGYIYYQMGRIEPAKKTIEAAHQGMPQSQAVIALKQAIESASR